MGTPSPARQARPAGIVQPLAWSIAGVSIALSLAAIVFHLIDRQITTAVTQWWLTNVTNSVCLAIPGALLASRRPRNPIGWIFLTIGLGQAVTAAGREYAIVALAVHHGHLPGGVWAAWAGAWGWECSLLSIAAILLFPSGRLPSWRWWPVLIATVAAAAIGLFGTAVYPGPVLGGPGLLNSPNPLGWPAGARLVDAIGWDNVSAVLTAAGALSCLALISRIRRAGQPLRAQLTVVVIPAVLLTAEESWELWQYTSFQPFLSTALIVLVTIAIATSILRYGVFDIGLVVNRAIVYFCVSALLLAAYLGTATLAALTVGHSSSVGSAVAVALVVVLFAPLRLRLQTAADRLLYGARRDPYHVISTLGEQLPETDTALPALAQTVARILKLPYVSISLATGVAAQVGADRYGDPLVVALDFQNERVGTLTLGRRGAESFAADEERLFDDIGRQVAVAAHAVQLTTDLQRSRENLVVAREEERRRIRRDLHDGLGPALAGIALQLDVARAQVSTDAAGAEARLGALVVDTQASIADIRRLVDDLRPPALDELGLESALREQAARFPDMQVEVISDAALTDLPAAVEVAAYRIATEAVTNAARHSAAAQCTVRLELNGSLQLEISDNGSGMTAGWVPGIGVTSIHERAAELGGTCTLSDGETGGTIVRARLPVARR